MNTHGREVVIIDYGMGNLFSLERVIAHLGGRAVISNDTAAIESAERLILPGVGAFGDGIRNLRSNGLDRAIENFIGSKKPLLGICLGMQLLMSESEEHGRHEGLGVVSGRVVRFLEPDPKDVFYKIPHVGWNALKYPPRPDGNGINVHNPGNSWEKTILGKVREGAFVYFVHSYTVVPSERDVVLSETVYGRDRFCSALRKGNVWGCQFHPEVSGEIGLRILREFLSMV